MFLFSFPPSVTVSHPSRKKKKKLMPKKKKIPNFFFVVSSVRKADNVDKSLANIHIIFLTENHLIFTAIIYFSFDENMGYLWQADFRTSQHSSHNSKKQLDRSSTEITETFKHLSYRWKVSTMTWAELARTLRWICNSEVFKNQNAFHLKKK